MQKEIKITPKLKFDYYDLMLGVDFSHEFTLKDVVRAVINSKIPLESLMELIRCPYLVEYWKEINSKRFKDDGIIDYLELYWWGTSSTYMKIKESHNSWCFHGVGKKGVVCKDLMEYYTKGKIAKMKKDGYRENYAIEFSPIYQLANYKIKLNDEMIITDYDKMGGRNAKKYEDDRIKFKPSITLIELLYTIFWELSFMGSPEKRDKKNEELKNSVAELDAAHKNGTIATITVPWSEVKKNLKKKQKEFKKRALGK